MSKFLHGKVLRENCSSRYYAKLSDMNFMDFTFATPYDALDQAEKACKILNDSYAKQHDGATPYRVVLRETSEVITLIDGARFR